MPQYLDGQIVSDINLNANGAQVNNTVISGTFTSPTNITTLWDIPANSTTSRSAFRLTAVGTTSMGTTGLNTQWGIGYGPNAATQFIIDQEAQPASAVWYYTVTVWVMVNIGGSGGQAYIMGQIRAGQIPNNSAVNWTLGVLPAAWNTTVDNKLSILGNFSASTGTPVFTNNCSVLERLG